jgi:NAD(P) transhydrogenase
MSAERFDLIVIGSGPAGQKAAIQAVKAGRRVALLEREAAVGGACVHRGTIPSKTLRDAALRATMPSIEADAEIAPDIEVKSLTTRLEHVVRAHADYMGRQLERNGIVYLHGRARFLSPHELEVRRLDGSACALAADVVVIATGSRPRAPAEVPIDHEHVLDSDSILSMIYLPRSLTVLGGGVIASEYASIFARLGVRVTMIDVAPRPLRFADAEIVERFVSGFAANGGRYVGGHRVASVRWDGLAAVRTVLEDGSAFASEKMLVALGRVANVEDLGLAAAGLSVDERGLLPVDQHCRTRTPNIYAVGDVIGPPALASSAMEQGRRAVCHALGLDPGHPPELSPIGIYTIPEIATVGLDELEARKRHGSILVGRARFDEVARGQIAGMTDGLLKLVADASGHRLLGAHIVGEGATELIHVAQMALIAALDVDAFIENIFNFPTLAEAYRVAALDIAGQRQGGAARDGRSAERAA